MFCDRCGAALQQDQRFCGRCGKEFSGTIALSHPRLSRVQEHIRLLGILWLALSAVDTVAGVVLFIIANTLFAHLHEIAGTPPDIPAGFLRSFLCAISVVILAKAVCWFLCGMGTAAARTLGAHADHRSFVPGLVPRSARHCAWDL